MTDSIFPFVDPQETEITTQQELSFAKEWAWDFKRLDFKTKNGKMYLVEGTEAVKVWIWKLFMTQRYRALIFTWDYGNELENLIGKGYTQGLVNAEAERYVREATGYNLKGYVTDVRNVITTFRDETLTIEFIAITPYGEVEISV